MAELLKKYRDMILYVFFGGCTTLINILAYFACTRMIGLDTTPANVAAWLASVLFAYLTNRKWVFHSRQSGFSGILREIFSFFASRAATGALDIAIMFVCVDLLLFPDVIVKVLSNVLVIVLNYVLSRIFVFRDKK